MKKEIQELQKEILRLKQKLEESLDPLEQRKLKDQITSLQRREQYQNRLHQEQVQAQQSKQKREQKKLLKNEQLANNAPKEFSSGKIKWIPSKKKNFYFTFEGFIDDQHLFNLTKKQNSFVLTLTEKGTSGTKLDDLTKRAELIVEKFIPIEKKEKKLLTKDVTKHKKIVNHINELKIPDKIRTENSKYFKDREYYNTLIEKIIWEDED